MEWKPINSRLMKIRLREKHINTTIIQCYAPTNNSEEESKEAFYEQLQAELENTPGHEMKIVIGDLNAKVGSDNTNYERAMGKEGCGSMNNNERDCWNAAGHTTLSLAGLSFHTQVSTNLPGVPPTAETRIRSTT